MEQYEHEAVTHAGKMAGEYLDTLSASDLAHFTPAQWWTLLEVICINFAKKRAELQPCPF